jgi:hypothetical protein
LPSPLGHALAATAAGWGVARPKPNGRPLFVQTAIFSVVGAVADLDLLIHRHRAETHSIGAAAIVATVGALWRWPVADRRRLIWFALFAAYCTHPLLDALADDSSFPFGVMAMWPFNSHYYLLPPMFFGSIYRNWREAGFAMHNLLAVLQEVAILGPITALTYWLKGGQAPSRGLSRSGR